MHFDLPWKDLDSSIYESAVKSEKKFVKMYAWGLSILLIGLGFFTKIKLTIMLGALLLITVWTKKYVVVTERGLEIFYDMKITKSYQLWRWEELYALTHEFVPENRSLIRLYFTKDDRTKRFDFKREHLTDIVAYAKKSNKKIKIFDAAKQKMPDKSH